MMAVKLDKEQNVICMLLAAVLNGRQLSEQECHAFASVDLERLFQIADRHRVLPLLYDTLCESGLLNDTLRQRLDTVSRQAVRQGYRLLFLTKYLVRILEQEGIPTVVLKGTSVAACYPLPELRCAGDVDLMVREKDLKRAQTLLEQVGYRVSDSQHANHHRVFCSGEGIDIELHVLPAEPFSNKKVNECMKQMTEGVMEQRVMGECMGVELPVLSAVSQALQLLLHMLQHFLRAGFGLRLLCDWTVFWNRQDEDVWIEFRQRAEEFGIWDFAATVTETCVEAMGLCKDFLKEEKRTKPAEAFLCEVFEAEDFGNSAAERMVAIQGKGIRAYIKEFHYQMKINHPKASKCVLLWPALWVITLIVFICNNHKLKRGSVKEIMRSAGKRGKLVSQMGLWGEKDED